MRLILSVILYTCFLSAGFSAPDTQSYKIKVVYPYKHPIPHQITLDNLTEEVKFFTEFGLLFVKIKVNGEGPFVFWLDTGSEISIISKELVDQIKLPLISKTRHKIQASYSQASISSYLTVAPRLQMDKVSFKNAPFITIDKKSSVHKLFDNLGVKGLIGINMFHGTTLTINFKNNTLMFQKHVIPSKNTLRMRGVYFFPVISAVVNQNNSNKVYPFLIDTGFNGGIEMPDCNKAQRPHHKESHSMDFFNKIERGFLTKINGHIKVGNMKIPDPVVRYAESNCKKKRPFGLLGTQFFKGKIITINLEKRVLSIQ